MENIIYGLEIESFERAIGEKSMTLPSVRNNNANIVITRVLASFCINTFYDNFDDKDV